MSRVAYVNCSAGVAGDMLLGALVDAGARPEAIAAAVAAMEIDGYGVAFERTQRCGVVATLANVIAGDDSAHTHRPVQLILDLLAAADLADAVRARAERVFGVLADAEGAVHGVDPGVVELHEVGAHDAIVDVVGIAAALDDLAIDRLVASPIAVGHGSTRSAHGELPNPPPAVARLAASRNVPLFGIDTGMEVSTPTGVAVLVALADGFGAMPAMAVTGVGYGAGTADPPGRPNVVQVIVGDAVEASLTPAPGQPIVELATNVDDVTGEVLAHTITVLLAAGAHDAWASPTVMKKGRPAHTLHALVDPAHVERLAALLLAETGSLGVRATPGQRWPQRRTTATVDLEGYPVRIKVAGHRVKAEHDDAAAAAAALGRPLRDVLRHVESTPPPADDAS